MKAESNYKTRNILSVPKSIEGIFKDVTGGVWDRMRIIPFEKVIRGSVEDNPNLKYELIEELPGILNWAICSLSGLLDERIFPQSPEGLEVLKSQRIKADVERRFLTENYEENLGSFYSTVLLYKEYVEWTQNLVTIGCLKFVSRML